MAWQHKVEPNDDLVQDDIRDIKEQAAETDGKKLTWKEMLSNGKDMNLWRFSAACGSQAMQQVTGINLVTYYSTVVFGEFETFNLWHS